MSTASAKVEKAVKTLIVYGIVKEMIIPEEAVFAANSIFDVLGAAPSYEFSCKDIEEIFEGKELKEAETNLTYDVSDLEQILKVLLDDAAERELIDGGIASRDLLDTKIMGCITPRPGEMLGKFRALYAQNPESATDYFYKLSCDSDYIRSYRIKKDRKWISPTKYGDLDITINLSKPEKDPKAIAAALTKKQDSYPKCLLCHENEGYAGRLDHPARQTIRQVPLKLGGEKWYLQYSPYVYYNEHCIVLSANHEPMRIDHGTFVNLMDFLKQFPHYTVGSNADLPIVGGSILTHQHYQGGNYTFAMARADIREPLTFKGFEDVKAGIVNWPMSVIRLDGEDPDRIIELADKILAAWRGYTDAEADIFAETDKTPHNTITPIARMRGNEFELDLVLRNNRTTEEYPLGIFHPHAELHHIKKENIGLIEVMGLAVLPSRLLGEIELLKEAMCEGNDIAADERIAAHAEWAQQVLAEHPELNRENAEKILQDEIGIVFAKVLEHAGVFKDSAEGRKQFCKFAAYAAQ